MSSRCPVLNYLALEKWTVKELREELKRRNLKSSGLKAQLIERLKVDTSNGEELGKKKMEPFSITSSEHIVDTKISNSTMPKACRTPDLNAASLSGTSRDISNDDNDNEGVITQYEFKNKNSVNDKQESDFIPDSVHSTDSMPANEKNELKDTCNAGDFHGEAEVGEPKGAQTTSGRGSAEELDTDESSSGRLIKRNVLERENSWPTNTENLRAECTHIRVLDEQLNTDGSSGTELMERNGLARKNCERMNTERLHAECDDKSEIAKKLNIDGNSHDELLDKDVVVIKNTEGNNTENVCAEQSDEDKPNLVHDIRNQTRVADITGGLFAGEEAIVFEEETRSTVLVGKRKVEDNEVAGRLLKRKHRWHPDQVKDPQPTLRSIITTDAFQSAHEQVSTRCASNNGGSKQQEVVPRSKKPATNSLKIKHFVRPFTLEAVKALLAETGTVCHFWMDDIKTHCYVTYSSVEEADITRKALYGLRWPSRSEKRLLADFVDPQQVEIQCEKELLPSTCISKKRSAKERIFPPLPPP